MKQTFYYIHPILFSKGVHDDCRYKSFKTALLEHAEADREIKAIIATGSSTRTDVQADEFSDLDLIIVSENTQRWYSGEYPELPGR